MEQNNSLTQSLARIQARLKAPKGQYNAFGKYAYRSCEDILEAVKPLLSEEQVILTISDDIIMVGTRIYIKATATITNGLESFSNVAFAREEDAKKGMDASQVTGAASSYARKYALNGLFLIDDNKDADAGSPQPQQTVSVNDAINEVNACRTPEEVSAVWNKYSAQYGNNNDFRNAVIAKNQGK